MEGYMLVEIKKEIGIVLKKNFNSIVELLFENREVNVNSPFSSSFFLQEKKKSEKYSNSYVGKPFFNVSASSAFSDEKSSNLIFENALISPSSSDKSFSLHEVLKEVFSINFIFPFFFL
jgi:hypothetical protein